MNRRDYLPRAVELSANKISELDSFELSQLQLECVDWLVAAKEFRCEVKSPNSVIIWDVLVKLEIRMVNAAASRIADERRSREHRNSELRTFRTD